MDINLKVRMTKCHMEEASKVTYPMSENGLEEDRESKRDTHTQRDRAPTPSPFTRPQPAEIQHNGL